MLVGSWVNLGNNFHTKNIEATPFVYLQSEVMHALIVRRYTDQTDRIRYRWINLFYILIL